MVQQAPLSLSNGPSFRQRNVLHPSGYSGRAAIPKEDEAGAPYLRRRISWPLRVLLIGQPYSDSIRDVVGLHRSVSSAIVRRRHPPPTGTVRQRSPCPRCRGASADAPMLHQVLEFGTPFRPTRAPPVVSLPGPFATACYQAALAAYLHHLRRSSSKDFCTGTDPHR
jgi:hypothetical protein